MDEILASIRKIVSDDVPTAKAGGRASAAKPAEAAAGSSASPRQQKAPAVAQAEAAGATAKNSPGVPDPAVTAALVSPAVRAEAAASFATLGQAVFNKNARTVEDVMQDLLRPMLQSWLDAHLPGLVERLVRQEIERISGRS